MFNMLNVTTPKNAAEKMSIFVCTILNFTASKNVAEKMHKFVFRMLNANPDIFSCIFRCGDIQHVKHKSGHFFGCIFK